MELKKQRRISGREKRMLRSSKTQSKIKMISKVIHSGTSTPHTRSHMQQSGVRGSQIVDGNRRNRKRKVNG